MREHTTIQNFIWFLCRQTGASRF